MLTRYRSALAALVLLCSASVAAAPGFVVRTSELRSTPSFSGQVTLRLSPGTALTLLERRGGWRQVELKANRQRGWVRNYQVRAGQVPSSVVSETRDEERGVLSDLASVSRSASGLFGGKTRSGSNQTTATIGIRGLSAEELKAARPDQAELERLKRYGASPEAGKAFARSANLKQRRVNAL